MTEGYSFRKSGDGVYLVDFEGVEIGTVCRHYNGRTVLWDAKRRDGESLGWRRTARFTTRREAAESLLAG